MKRFALAACLVVVAGCPKKEKERVLRGFYEPSPDGQSYLVVDEGKACGLELDGKPWAGKVGVKEALTPGVHRLECAGTTPATAFEIRPQRVFHFDYWGP